MFELTTNFKPSGDQPEAIKTLTNGINNNVKKQVLLGVTGSGKTFTIANVINNINKPTLILAHNKTLAGQLYSEFKDLFPNNKVEYFVSYYDYYQPEAYVPSSDTFIEKDASVNDEIDELRHGATSALIKNRDVIVISSVSCIYGIGEVEEYKNKMLVVSLHDKITRNEIIEKLIDMTYDRNDYEFKRGTFRVNGDIIDVIPASERKNGIKIQLDFDEVSKISEFEVVTGVIIKELKNISINPASHFVTSPEKLEKAIKRIEKELEAQLKKFEKEGKLLEKQRLEERVKYDIEMLRETGFTSGVENYARHLSLREEGETPNTLMDFFGDDYLLVIDESHVTLPQVRAMYNGDRARKKTLVEYGFRLPSALDNRPLKFEEFEEKTDNIIYVSATPGDYELDEVNNNYVESIIRPTGLLDPTIEVRPKENQINDLIREINIRTNKNERVFITTLTIKMAEELTNYLKELDIKVAYLHSEIKTFDRLKIIRDLRRGVYDVLIGINLLREGLDIPEVSLIMIMDADKQGFLRSTRSLVQTIGRAARNVNGHVILYANKHTPAMNEAISETDRRRKIQKEYNKKHNIKPQTIKKEIRGLISNEVEKEIDNKKVSKRSLLEIEREMKKAAKELDFEKAMQLRDILFEMKAGIK